MFAFMRHAQAPRVSTSGITAGGPNTCGSMNPERTRTSCSGEYDENAGRYCALLEMKPNRENDRPHPGPTALELRVSMKISSFLDVQSKYIGYSKWGCARSLKAFPSLSLILSTNCGGNSAICSSAGAIAYVRRTSHGSGN